MGRQHAKGSDGMVTVAAACEAGAAGARIGAEVEKAMQAWDTAIAAMGRLNSPVIVASAAATAMQLTAKTWDFKTPDTVEAVMLKIESRSPLTFTNPHLGTVLRVIAGSSTEHPERGEPTAVIWNAIKAAHVAQTGSSS